MIDLRAVAAADVTKDPFEFFLARVVSPDDLAAISRDFPKIDGPGVYPLDALQYGDAFARLIDSVRSPGLARVVGVKLGIDLSGRPLMITVRGQAQARDGRIHTDTADKLVTGLLYLNDTWDEGGGRLRLLRGPDDLENYVTEIPPDGGVLAMFKVGHRSWHGHKPFVGKRRYIMFNWLQSEAALNRQLGRHRISAHVKRLVPALFGGLRKRA